MSAVHRLTPQALEALPGDVVRPRYERARLEPGIVHLGLGAFARAHQAVVNEGALHATGDLRWGIVGVSLRSPDTRDALAPQGGLYTLALRDADAHGRPRESLQVVGGLVRVLVAPEDPAAVLDALAHPQARIVSLTVTEKGYCHEPATRKLRLDHPDIVHDLAHPAQPRSAIGYLVRGLQRRYEAGLGPLTLLSCDNLSANGDTLRGLVLAFAAHVDEGLRAWIATHCRCPNSMVDRIVPQTTDGDREAIGRRLGCVDAWPVVGEPFLEWVVEDDFAAGRPAWELAGARFVRDAAPFERLKLRFVNAPQSMLAYLGAVAGMATNNDAIAHPELRRLVDATMRHEIAPTLADVAGVDLDALRERLLARVANPALPHRTQQVAMDGSQKLPQRWLGTVADCLRQERPFDGLALALAGWMHYLRGEDATGQRYPIHDPLAEVLAGRLRDADALAAQASRDADQRERARVAHFGGLTSVFGGLGREPGFIEAVARQSQSLRQLGVLAAARACVGAKP